MDEAEQSGVIPRAQEELLHNVFDFPDREVRDVMTPALDVVWLDAGLTPDEALDRVAGEAHSRYPVGRGSVDRARGRRARARPDRGRAEREAPRSPSWSGRR